MATNLVVTYDEVYAARYTTMPIMLIIATGVVAVDACLRRQAGGRQQPSAGSSSRIPLVRLTPRALTAVATLTCVLALGWASDYRYGGETASWGYWKPRSEQMLMACAHSTSGKIPVWAWRYATITVPCYRLRR